MTTHPLPVRTTDPGTSYAAAQQAIKGRPRIREAVLTLLRVGEPMTHDQMHMAINEMHSRHPDGWPAASPSGLRTRVSELVRDGLVEPVPDHLGRSDMGNRALLWRATNV